MATGTDIGGRYRLTAGARLSTAALTAVVVLCQLIAPSAALAATPWSREVRMQAEPVPDLIFEYSSAADPTCTLSGSWQTHNGACKSFESSSDSISAWIGDEIGEPSATGNPTPITPGHEYEFVVVCHAGGTHGDRPLSIRWGNAAGQESGDVSLGVCNAYDEAASNLNITLPATSVSVPSPSRLHVRGDFWRIVSYLRIRDLDTLTSGAVDCHGAPGPGGDDGLVIPAPGLSIRSDHTMWGDEPINESAHGSYGSCRFTQHGSFRYYPPEGITEGETHTASVQVSTDWPWQDCSVTIFWGGERIGAWLQFNYTGLDEGTTGDGVASKHSNAPEGARYIDIRLSQGCNFAGLYLANVEGDPVLDNGQDGTDPESGVGPGGNPWATCQPGTDFLAVGEWVAYAACLIAGLPIALAHALMGLVAQLFLPTMIGDRWDEFIEMASSRVPFGWFSEISGNVEDSTAAGASSIGALTLSIGGASVNIGDSIDDAMTGAAPYRGLLFAGVALVMGLGCLRWIMAAVGVSPGGGHSGGPD